MASQLTYTTGKSRLRWRLRNEPSDTTEELKLKTADNEIGKSLHFE